MAKTTFTADELSKQLYFELVKHSEEGPQQGRIDFHGFVTQDAFRKARMARQSLNLLARTVKIIGQEVPMSDWLMALALVFAEIESHNQPMPENPCAEVRLPMMDRTNLKDE